MASCDMALSKTEDTERSRVEMINVLDDSLHEIHDAFWCKSTQKMERMKDWEMI